MPINSRLSLVQDAVRPALKAKMMLSGPTGSGKTATALIVATRLAEGGEILLIDTEKESALTYADDFTFKHMPWHPPFDTSEFVEVLHAIERDYAVVIIDSSTHFWRGQGGILSVAHGKFTGWNEARTIQEAFTNAILGSPTHIILCTRSKMGHVQEKGPDGRERVRQIGMEDQQDDDLAYELNVAFQLTMDHTSTVSKSRCRELPVNREYPPSMTAEMADTYLAWLKGGEPPAGLGVVTALLARMNALPDGPRHHCKGEFNGSFGRPEQLRESRVADAEALIARYEEMVGKADPETGEVNDATTEEAASTDPAEAPFERGEDQPRIFRGYLDEFVVEHGAAALLEELTGAPDGYIADEAGYRGLEGDGLVDQLYAFIVQANEVAPTLPLLA